MDDKDEQDGNGFNPHIDAQNYESCSSSSSTTSSSSNDEDNQRTVPANNQYQDAIATKIQRLTIPEQRLGRPLLEKAEALGHSNGRSTETHPDLEVLLESLIPTSSKSATPASTSIARPSSSTTSKYSQSKRKSNDHSSDHLTDDHNTVRINQKQQGLLHLDLPSIH
ncbi:hypothetical protein H4Q26_005171 [Puccinia striiformis f. sp. tritici PST-130]|nr:hypothetical protein H4Q26_005171 [Puccinia striiformis f. sp. tritici PST-130]